MRIFVTGATGVVGRRLVPALLADGHRVSGVARSPAGVDALRRLEAEPVQVDLFDQAAVATVVRGHDAIINLATHIPSSNRMFLPGAWSENDRIRREVSSHLVDTAIDQGIARFIQESFAPIYPSRGEDWIDEMTPVRPARYNLSVVDAEAAVARFNAAGGAGIVLRFALFHGPDSEYALTTIRSVRKGRAPSFGPADAYISSISHDDAAAAVSAVLDAPAGIYNVTDDEPLRRREYFNALAVVLGVPVPQFLPGWMRQFTGALGETLSRSQRISNAKLRGTCSWTPRYCSMREGWRAIVESGVA